MGLMLIVLGVLNLTGVTQWITNRFTPVHSHGDFLHTHSGAAGGDPHGFALADARPIQTPVEQEPQGKLQTLLARLGFGCCKT